MKLFLREFVLDLSKVKLMGILNLTPDSFSDGGKLDTLEAVLAEARQMIAEGADILDIGGESTRPGAAEVSPEEEQCRVLPVLEALLPLGIPLSIDTRKPEVAQEALALGAHLINDVTGLRDPRMVALCARFQTPAVVMHMPVPDPQTMQQHTHYADAVLEVRSFLQQQAQKALEAGIPQVVLDPGFGFGKTAVQNLQLVRNLDRFAELGHPVLLGASRKKTIGELTGIQTPKERLLGSVAIHLAGVNQGAKILRVHDLKPHREALDVWEAVYSQ